MDINHIGVFFVFEINLLSSNLSYLLIILW